MVEKYKIDADFYLYHFKTVWCPYREDDHDRKVCLYAHNWQDYRRKPNKFSYSHKMCPNWKTDTFITSFADGCHLQYQCGFSHGWKEQEYHPSFFKQKQCKHGVNCAKAHCPYFHDNKDKILPTGKWFRHFPKSRVGAFPNVFYLGNYGTS